ncbi:hypothetical protein [uncultured Anaerococcus sp.]|uniref:hypothetical protein n=1 Tax=uncultured Anaerococcus sp. TaxID=293428 RepID=UPI00288965E6|nr:hypothetical protein [uncultured Anaerococcus sp.]
MSGIINLISEYSPRLAILPILALMNVIITFIIHFVNSKKILKFLPSLIIGIGALIIGIYSVTIFNSPMGLNTAWIAIFLGATSLIGICFGFIIDLAMSIRKNMGLGNKSTGKRGRIFNKQKVLKAKRKRYKEKDNE